jgi:CubicO group peptidase (beta-lactamase class C family)
MLRALLAAAAAVLIVLQLQPAARGAAAIPPAGTTAITGFLQAAVDRGAVPGMVALVLDRRGVIYHEAFGKQDVGRNIPMARDTIFRIASMTKPVTSMGVMMLVEEGRLKLDDDAATWIPSLRKRQVLVSVNEAAGTYETRPVQRPITIRQLLTHTSGIGYAWSDPGLALVQKRDNPAEDALPLVHEPGERWTYGSSTRVLGDIIESLSGQRIDRFLQARVFRPLAMHDTFFEVPTDKYARVVTTHQKADGKLTEQPLPAQIPVSLRADGGLLSTAGDYARFMQMLLTEGELDGVRILSERTVGLVGENHMGRVLVRQQPSATPGLSRPFPLGAGADTWGLGFQRAARPKTPNARSEGSLSWAGIYNTEFWIDPKKGIGAILMMQMLPFYDEDAIQILQGFESLVYQHLK